MEINCPHCAGQGTYRSIVCEPRRCFTRGVPCETCTGTGQISPERQRQIEDGHRLQLWRVSQRISLRDLAPEHGLTPVELSAIEAGQAPMPEELREAMNARKTV